MTATPDQADGRRFAGWMAIVSAIIMVAGLALSLSVTGDDTNLMFDPAKALALSADKIAGFKLFLLADSFGYYLSFVVMGGYLWRRLRGEGGAIVDAAAMAITVYVVLGLVGTGFQYAVLSPLAALHASADPAARAASEATWLAVAVGMQNGVWLMEGPTMGFWAIITGLAMRAQGMKFGLLLGAAGLIYAIKFILTCAGADEIAELLVILGVLLLPVWMLLTGASLLRQSRRRP